MTKQIKIFTGIILIIIGIFLFGVGIYIFHPSMSLGDESLMITFMISILCYSGIITFMYGLKNFGMGNK